MPLQYDIIVFGGGVAGLWVANALKGKGYNVILIEKEKLGAGQTLASQGMIHGGQKARLQWGDGEYAAALARMPGRWEKCFRGDGEVELKGVKFLNKKQFMWPAGALLSTRAQLAAKLVNTKVRKLKKDEFPAALREKEGPVYELPEKVLDVRSLVRELAKNLEGRLLRGKMTRLLPDGQVTVSGRKLRAQMIIFTAGVGNDRVLELLGQRVRTWHGPVRQIMVRTLPVPLYGHGIVGDRTRVTVTSHRAKGGGYIWYLGGEIAENGAEVDEGAALVIARRELQEIFPEIDWSGCEWASWYGNRAEPNDEKGEPVVRQHGHVLLAWPIKLTFAPALWDQVRGCLEDMNIRPFAKTKAKAPLLPAAKMGSYPWETARWHQVT